MKKLLYITYRFPWPLTGGGKIRIFNFGKILSKKYDVDLLTLNIGDVKENIKKELEEKNIFNKIFFFPFRKEVGIINTLHFIKNNKPLQINFFFFKKIKKFIENIYENYDVLFCSTIRTSEYIKTLPIKKYLDYIDAISLNYKEGMKKFNGIWKLIYKIEYNRLRNYELEMLDKFNKTFITSPYDKKYLKNKPIVITNGVDPKLLERKNEDYKEENYIVFFGKMDYNPNIDAVCYFVKKILPLLEKDIKFYIVGTNPCKKVLNLQNKRITVTGFLKDPYIIIQKSKLVIAPIRFSGGIQNKILESMALGKCVVTTSNCARSISNELIIGDTPNEMAEKINELLKDKEKRDKLGKRYRKIIKDKFTWEKIEKKVLNNV